jgi:hypothetical protein
VSLHDQGRGNPAALLFPDRRRWLLGGVAALAGCAGVPSEPAPPGSDGWHQVHLPGKTPTLYGTEPKAGRTATWARAASSASMWRRRVPLAPDRIGGVAFSWWVDRLIPGANLAQAEHADAPVRVLFGFDGDHARLSPRARAMYELAHALTGERPPFATLMYVWDNQAPVESVLHSARTDRVRKIVLDSGSAQLGRWRDHRRALAQDFQRAFGEAPGPLLSVALMTDADNTRSTAQAWYGPVRFY